MAFQQKIQQNTVKLKHYLFINTLFNLSDQRADGVKICVNCGKPPPQQQSMLAPYMQRKQQQPRTNIYIHTSQNDYKPLSCQKSLKTSFFM